MPRGAKPGEYRGGRKAGVPNVRTQEIAAQALKDGISALEVMVHNYRFWHHQGEALAHRLAEVLIPKEGEEAPEIDRKEVMRMVDKFTEFRVRAQECAVDAAPYMHPRLAAITVKQDTTSTVDVNVTVNTVREGADRFTQFLKGSNGSGISSPSNDAQEDGMASKVS